VQTAIKNSPAGAPGQTQVGKARRPNFLVFPARSGRAKSPMGASGPCAARPAMLISRNNSARFPLYAVDGGVRRVKRNMNAMIRARAPMRLVALAALAGPSLRRLGAAPAGSGCRSMEPAGVLCQIPKPRPCFQPKAVDNHMP
jgi:hypothetical protein